RRADRAVGGARRVRARRRRRADARPHRARQHGRGPGGDGMTGPAHVPAGRPGVGLTGEHARLVEHGGPGRTVVLDGLDVPLEAGLTLRWALLPVLDAELTYRSTHVAVDLLLDDDTWLSETGPGRALTDQHGMAATAQGQGAARILVADHW